jgi:hypothetical protein
MFRFLAMAAIALGLGSAAPAATLAPTHDAFVRGGGFANATHDLASLLLKSQGGANWQRRALLQFDVSGATGFSGSLLSFTLSAAAPFATNVQIWAMADSAGDGWSETTLTFNNAPAFGATGTASATLLGSVAVANGTAAGTTFGFGGAALESFLATGAGADNLVTFGLISSNTTSTAVMNLHSAESTTGPGPSLTVEVAAVPLPATAGLLAAGLGALALARRRRRDRP